MKPTQEQVLDWANQVWGTDLGKPWSQAALLHITELANLAYEAGRKDENEACAKHFDENSDTPYYGRHVAAAIRARREQ